MQSARAQEVNDFQYTYMIMYCVMNCYTCQIVDLEFG